MMDAKELLNSLTIDEIKTILIELGAQHIEDLSESKGHLITNTICHNISDGKMKLYYYTESNGKFEGRKFHCFTACGDNFNVYELVKRNHELKGIEMRFPDVIGWICSKTGRKNYGYSKPEGFSHEEEKINDELEYLKKFDKKKIEPPKLVEHDECILGRFTNHHHQSWLEDGVSHETMNRYEVMYDYYRHRIILPHRHWETGGLIGIKCRSLEQNEIDKGFKYIPLKTEDTLYSYPSYFNLYGYWQNREYIKKIKKIILFEAEKSVHQVESMYGENNFSSSLMGSNISQAQVDMLINDGIEEVIIALDREYIDIDSPQGKSYQQKIIRMGLMMAQYMRVAVLVDTENRLKLKDSPSDQGQEVLEQLLKEKQYIQLME